MRNFRTYNLAVIFYKQCQNLKMPYYLKDQLNRSTSSIVLNLAEGSSKPLKDRRRFYRIAFASFRESEAVLDILELTAEDIKCSQDKLGAHLYKLIKALE